MHSGLVYTVLRRVEWPCSTLLGSSETLKELKGKVEESLTDDYRLSLT